MKVHRIFADLLFTNDGPPLRSARIDVDEEGLVLGIVRESKPADGDVHVTVAAPGFVNAHCHLELSHLKGHISDDARGMAYFIGNMMAFRQSGTTLADASFMDEADRSMWAEGVVAVGDISNTLVSLLLKSNSLIRYHTFIEVMGLARERAETIWGAGNDLKKEFDAVLGVGSASITPHALYSVSRELLGKILESHPLHAPLSIHMLESQDELDYCRDKSGPLARLFAQNNVPDSGFVPYGNESPLLSLLNHMPEGLRLQTVHNTFVTTDEIPRAAGLHDNLYWCLCPSANLFITGRLPDVISLFEAGSRITIGTDSLASNDRLSMVKELTLLQEQFPELPTEDLVRWATLHGAQFLGLDHEFGSVVAGKRPGFVVLENMDPDTPRFHKGVLSRRLQLE